MQSSVLFGSVATACATQDSRNRVQAGPAGSDLNLPSELAEAYSREAPLSIFIRVDGGLSLALLSLHELAQAQGEYSCGPYFVFATLEGDPIALRDGHVWQAEHGNGAWRFQRTAESLSEFWQQLLERME